ncbi:uncharacterized protein LOC119262282 [Pygocentrus nattereri]|uniref:uncharacterized protein LOC119262282 n=1 Tax=Pygocentrus nattereri TaxID=42514 RepID=UPI0018911C08|nr:uncharacterized protein LOC119262282 [Pygocentrus nattereri]
MSENSMEDNFLDNSGIWSASHRQSGIVSKEKRIENDKEIFESKTDNPVLATVMNGSENKESTLGKGMTKTLCITAYSPELDQKCSTRKYSSSKQKTSFDLSVFGPGVNRDLTCSEDVLVPLITKEATEPKDIWKFHSDLNLNDLTDPFNTSQDVTRLKHGKDILTLMGKCSTAVPFGSLAKLGAKKVVTAEPPTAKVGVSRALLLCVKRDCEPLYQTALSCPLVEIKTAPEKNRTENSSGSPLHEILVSGSVDSHVGKRESSIIRKLESNGQADETKADGVDERETLTPSLQREKQPLYFTAVVTSPQQIHHTPEKGARKSTDVSYLFVPQTEIQSMNSGLLASDTPKTTKIKGPPPPIPKKPKSPFSKVVAAKTSHATDEPRQYSELLLQNIKMGRRKAAIESVTEDVDKFPLNMPFCPGTPDSLCYMCMLRCFNLKADGPVDFCDERVTSGMALWTKTVDVATGKEPGRLDISQMRHILEKKAKIKGPPPPIPKKPPNAFAHMAGNVLSTTNSISEGTACYLKDDMCDYKPYIESTMAAEEPELSSVTSRNDVPAADSTLSSDSCTLDGNGLSRYRPVSELVRETNQLHPKMIRCGSKANETTSRTAAARQTVKVLQMTKTFDVKKTSTTKVERKPLTKKECSSP